MGGDDRPGLVSAELESDALPKTLSVRLAVVRLVREKRYEEALAVLYSARAEAPAERELQMSIVQIKEFLVGTYAKRLGGLDRVAGPIPLSAVRSPDALLVARYVDGAATFGDIAQTAPLGQLRTLQVLASLYSGSESEASQSPMERMPMSGLWPVSESAGAASPRLTSRAPEAPVPEPVGHSLPPPAETEDDRQYRQAFARGATAFVQNRFAEAAEAFDACERLRPGDSAASVMLRRALRDLSR